MELKCEYDKIAGTVESDGTEKEIPYAEKPMESNQWYYNRLTDVEKKIYTTIYNYYKFDMDKGECRMENVKVVTKDKITIANMYQASTAVVLDNPSIFWIRYFNHTQMKEKMVFIPEQSIRCLLIIKQHFRLML